jgi:hypothetical protein
MEPLDNDMRHINRFEHSNRPKNDKKDISTRVWFDTFSKELLEAIGRISILEEDDDKKRPHVRIRTS